MEPKLLLLVRSETLVMTRNQGVLMQEERTAASDLIYGFEAK